MFEFDDFACSKQENGAVLKKVNWRASVYLFFFVEVTLIWKKMAEKNERKGDSQIGHFLFF